MAWTATGVVSFTLPGKRQVHVHDCVYSGTGYGGGQSATGASGATGPTKDQLGWVNVVDSEFIAWVQQVPKGGTGGFYTRSAAYDVDNQKLLVGATAGTDISDTTYRVYSIGRYSAAL